MNLNTYGLSAAASNTLILDLFLVAADNNNVASLLPGSTTTYSMSVLAAPLAVVGIGKIIPGTTGTYFPTANIATATSGMIIA